MNGVIAKQLICILLCAALPLAAAGGVAEELPDDLMSVIDFFYAAVENDDIETRVALLDDEVVMMPNHWTMTAGRLGRKLSVPGCWRARAASSGYGTARSSTRT